MNLSSKSTAAHTRIVFMGTTDFAVTALQALIEAHYQIAAVYTQADKPVGRDQSLQATPMARYIRTQQDIPLEQPVRWDQTALDQLKHYQPDLIVVAAYGKILPAAVLDIPRFHCLNIHASLLPRFRGSSPIQHTLLAGDTETGITIMLMDAGMDTGPILTQRSLTVGATDTFLTLSNRLATLGSELLLETLPQWLDNKLTPIPQDESQALLCQMIEREDGHIFWNETAETLSRRYRAFTPWPGLFTFWQKNPTTRLRLKILQASFITVSPSIHHPLGTVFEIGTEIVSNSSSSKGKIP
jgi:methionyl-tRNA formyltransferase